jgi:hypothetical protein
MLNKVPNGEGSDTTEDEESDAVDYKKISDKIKTRIKKES